MLLIPANTPAQQAPTTFISKYAALLDILLRVGDVIIVVLVALIAYRLRFGQWSMADAYTRITLRALLLVLLIFPLFGLYRSWRGQGVLAEVGRATLAWAAAASLLLLSEWLVKSTGEYSRLWMVGWCIGTPLLLAMHRCAGRGMLASIRRHGIDARRVVVVGATEAARKIIAAARSHPGMGLTVVGYISTPFDQQPLTDTPLLGDLQSFVAQVRTHAPDQIWVALPLRAEPVIQQLLEATADMPVAMRLVPDLFGYELINQGATTVAGVPVITLRGSRIDGHARLVKAVEDRVLAALILLLLSPLMLLIALAVKLSSPGPVLYRQKRHGLGGQEIEVWKFRSMHLHRESDGKVTQASANDARVTRVGRLLRRASLDELPQFINVLQGRMSVVGPRPHAVQHNHEFSEKLRGYMQRHGVKPGITGLAQTQGFRGQTDTLEKMARRVECDIHYIKHWSLWLDLKTILLTPRALLKRTNAY